MKTLLVFLADGFEEVEALTVVDFIRRLDLKCTMVSANSGLKVRGAHDIEVEADITLYEVDLSESVGIVIPGGLPGSTNLRDDDRVIDLVREADEKGLLIASICAGPIVLERAGVLAGRQATSYPGLQDKLPSATYMEERVVVDGHVITARGPSIAADFAIEIVDYLYGEDKKAELKTSILYRIHE